MMQKKLIVVALAAAIDLPMPVLAYNANVTIYGVANLSFDMANNGNTAAAQGTGTNKVSSSASRIGFKGDEDTGGGLGAVWQIERAGIDNAGATFASRNSFAGLESEPWGQLVLGRHDTPYKIATRRLDIFGDPMGDNRALMGGGAKGKASALPLDSRPTDTVIYTSPNWGRNSAVIWL